MAQVIRFSKDASMSIVWDTRETKAVRCPTQSDMDNLPVGKDVTAKEIKTLDS